MGDVVSLLGAGSCDNGSSRLFDRLRHVGKSVKHRRAWVEGKKSSARTMKWVECGDPLGRMTEVQGLVGLVSCEVLAAVSPLPGLAVVALFGFIGFV